MGHPEAKRDAQTQWQVHLRKAEKARESLQWDSEQAKTEVHVPTVSFGPEKTSLLLSCSGAYYERPLWAFILGVHEMENNQVFIYMWSEDTANWG